jgi:hypothetical protein
MVPGAAAAGRRLPACLDWGWIRGSWGAVGFGVRAACRALLLVVDAGVARRRRVRPAVRYGRCGWGGWSACPGCSASWTWSRSAGNGWWIAIGLSQTGQSFWATAGWSWHPGRAAGLRLARCSTTADAARERAEPLGDGLPCRPGVVRARSGPVVDPVSLIASAWPSRMRDCDGGLRPESRCGQTGLHPWPSRRARGRRCARSVGRASVRSPAQGPAGP